MHVLVNALSVTNQSGAQLLAGHIGMLSTWLKGKHQFTILHHSSGEALKSRIEGVNWYKCPEMTLHWTGRSIWERLLPRVVRALSGDCLFSPAGIACSGVSVPQVVFCQNPWALVPEARNGSPDALKAWIQRGAYRRTVAIADTIVFNSEFMKKAYLANAKRAPKKTIVIHQGVSEAFVAAAAATHPEKSPQNLILSVSAWGNHKGLETVVEALALLRQKRKSDTRLAIMGQWPCSQYRRFIEETIRAHGLEQSVDIHGHVPTEELYRTYAKAKVFCLMSHCESFGFPAIEAQLFGTPTVCANSTAMPEIQGDGGLYPATGDANEAAETLARVLDDNELWQDLSSKAKANAHRYRWKQCSRAFIDVFNDIATGLDRG